MRLGIGVEFDGAYRSVGTIVTKPGIGAVFSYDKEWVEGASCWPLSLSIPIGEAEYSNRAIRPYFEGLLPEEYSRSVIAREPGVSGHGYLKVLAALGDECIGAVLVSNEGVKGDDESLSPYYMPLDEETFESLAAREYAVSSEIAAESRLSLAGSQSKVGLYRDPVDGSWWVPRGTAPSNCIVKPNSSRFAGIVDNELFCLDVARASGISVPFAYAAPTQAPMLVVERYDRKSCPADAPIDGHVRFRRLHQEDFCQALGMLGTEKYEVSRRSYARSMADALRRYASNPIEDILRFFDLIAFNFIIGNCDAHLKNYSLMRSDDWRELSLAPAYDLVSTTVYPELTTAMGLYVGEKKRLEAVERADFVELGHSMGLSRRAAETRIDMLRDRVVAAFEAQAADSADSEIARAIACQSKKRIDKLAVV